MSDPFIIMSWFSLFLVILFIQIYTFSDINIATSVFFWLLLTWCTFLILCFSLIFAYYISSVFLIGSIYLGVDFLFNLTVSAIWLRYLNPLHLIWLLIWFGFSLSSGDLFSFCFFSSFFYFSSLPLCLLLAY